MANFAETLFKNAEPLVKKVLFEKPETRGNDFELIFAVWEAQGVVFTDTQKKLIKKCYTPETITRCRRKIQETGALLPSKQRYEQRSLLEEDYRDALR